MKAEKQKIFLAKRLKYGRNKNVFDVWSVVHLATGMVMGYFIEPLTAIIIMLAWEPFEVLILSPLLARYSVNFGYESLQNSLSDMAVDIVGVGIGYYLTTL